MKEMKCPKASVRKFLSYHHPNPIHWIIGVVDDKKTFYSVSHALYRDRRDATSIKNTLNKTIWKAELSTDEFIANCKRAI